MEKNSKSEALTEYLYLHQRPQSCRTRHKPQFATSDIGGERHVKLCRGKIVWLIHSGRVNDAQGLTKIMESSSRRLLKCDHGEEDSSLYGARWRQGMWLLHEIEGDAQILQRILDFSLRVNHGNEGFSLLSVNLRCALTS